MLFLLWGCCAEIPCSSYSKTFWRQKLQDITQSICKSYKYVDHQKMKGRHVFHTWMCWSEHSLPQRRIGGYACSEEDCSKTGGFLRKNKLQWMVWLTKAWGKPLRTSASKAMTPTETAQAFLYSQDKVRALRTGPWVWHSSFSRETEADLNVDTFGSKLISFSIASRAFQSW